MIAKMSEARLNDLVYLILKKLFFEPHFNSAPRECDIRICMADAIYANYKNNPVVTIRHGGPAH